MPGKSFSIELQPNIPSTIIRIVDLANDLFYSWEREVRALFYRLDAELWDACGHNPKVFLHRVSQERLENAAKDSVFVQDYRRVLSTYETYLQDRNTSEVSKYLSIDTDLVAYFCLEFGLHESLPIYSGGLGILAGDHCKAASDLGIPFIAIGLLYRQGYFQQSIDLDGKQIAQYCPNKVADLPINAAFNQQGDEVYIDVDIGIRSVSFKVWFVKAGHIKLYLLDSDLDCNHKDDRKITYQLYGGDKVDRIKQEIALGIGGVKAIRALDLKPTVWHINEGHAAFQIIERCLEHINTGLDFTTAWETTAANTVFTTHTPVAAGHDIFPFSTIKEYLGSAISQLDISLETFLALGTFPQNDQSFNMTALALRGSRFHNGVSKIHGNVASHMEAYIWPEVPAEENPIRYVTNGVHVPTFLSSDWSTRFDAQFGGGWRNNLYYPGYWQCIDDIPDHLFWSIRRSLKTKMLEMVIERVVRQLKRHGCSESLIERITANLRPSETDFLTIGFARRFATYKRAALIFYDIRRLERLLNNTKRPVLIFFAGKAHPNDEPAQQIIKQIYQYTQFPEFEGKLFLIEEYDLSLARKLVTGVDVWLNNPKYPLEACGTSGQKAAINGAINLSILDGWWAEGYNGMNGWAITPHGPQFDERFSNEEEATELLDILEYQVIPLYYKRNGYSYSSKWVEKSKIAMKTVLPKFNAQRMLMDYVRDFYAPAISHGKKLRHADHKHGKLLAQWKQKIAIGWEGVSLHRVDKPDNCLKVGQLLKIEVAVNLNGLSAEDVIIECLFGNETDASTFNQQSCFSLLYRDVNNDMALFSLEVNPPSAGLQQYKIRIYPYHSLLAHPFEMGRMKWIDN